MIRHRRSGRLLTLAMAFVCSGAASGEGPIAFIDGVVIDGNGRKPIENGVVVVRDGRIEAVGDADTVRVPSDARVIDIEGRAILPGLADMHVHLMGGWDGVGSDWLGYQRYLNALLYSGVTTVFDLGNVMPFVLQLRDEVYRHLQRLPIGFFDRRSPDLLCRPAGGRCRSIMAAVLSGSCHRLPGSRCGRDAGALRRRRCESVRGAFGPTSS